MGGHTSCVAITADGDHVPRLVLDAGTGLRRLSASLDGRPFQGTLVLGHLHWDHTQGLPFFAAGDHPHAEVVVLGPAPAGDTLESVLARMISPPLFPIVPMELRGTWEFRAIEPGLLDVEGFEVLVREIPHKGGRTFGLRVSDGNAAVAYLSDHAPQSLGPGEDGVGEYHPAGLELARDAHLLIHDAQYTAEELRTRGSYGHAAAEYAVGLGERAGARCLALFHHDPARTDDQVEIIAESLRSRALEVVVAREGLALRLPSTPRGSR
ncbi:MAG TPA: MBL fold metallo-hydrolase [Acidimicrobiales bacterium]|nr:MBL fold metallo-hydrolase [Acidimicrobiales bacterium]